MGFRSRSRSTIVALFAAVALLAAGCGSSNDSNGETSGGAGDDLPPCAVDALDTATGPVEVLIWHSYVARTKDTLEKLVDQYNASQDKVRVRVESQGNSYDELWNKYQQSAQSGDLPAIAILEDTATETIVDSGTVLPAQSCIDADDYDTSDLVQSGVDYYSIDGAFYPASINMSSPLLYINKDHLRRANLDPETAPKTLAEVRDVAEAIKAAGVTQTPLAMNLTSWYVETWLTGNGSAMVDNRNGRGEGETTAAAFDNPDALEVVQWIKDMNDDGLLLPIPLVPGKIDHLLAMSGDQPKASMTFETSTAATSIQAFLAGDQSVVAEAGGGAQANNVSGMDIGATLFPGLREPGKVQIGGGAWYMTASQSDEVHAAAWDFMKWWNTPATQIVWHTEGSYIPFSQQAAQSPEVQQFWRSSLAGEWLALSYQQLSEGVDPDWPGPLIGPYQDVRRAVENALNQVALQGKAPADALAEAAEASTKAIEAYNEGGF